MAKSKAQIACWEYLYGHNKGNWKHAWTAAGFQKAPSLSEKSIKTAMADVSEQVRQDRQVELQEVYQIALAQFREDGNWTSLAEALVPVQIAIATGDLKPLPGQGKALETIMLRGFGRVSAVQEEKAVPGMIILPVQALDAEWNIDRGKDAHICGACREDVARRETKDEDSMGAQSGTSDSIS